MITQEKKTPETISQPNSNPKTTLFHKFFSLNSWGFSDERKTHFTCSKCHTHVYGINLVYKHAHCHCGGIYQEN